MGKLYYIRNVETNKIVRHIDYETRREAIYGLEQQDLQGVFEIVCVFIKKVEQLRQVKMKVEDLINPLS